MARWRDSFWDTLSVLVYGAILLMKTYFVKFSFVGNVPLHRSFWLGTLGATLVLTALLLLFKPRWRYHLFLGINLVVSLILVADVVYARYFNDVTSVALLRQAKLAAGVQDSVLALIKPRDLAYFFDLLVLIPATLWVRRRRSYTHQFGLSLVSKIALSCICLLVGNNLIQASIASLQERQPGLIRAFWDKQVIAQNIGNLNFHAIDVWRYAKKQVASTRLPQEEQAAIKAWFAAQTKAANTKNYQNAMQGKNLIMVQLEAFQSFVLNLEVNGQEVTPNLNRLAKQSLVFNNAYYQTAMGGTSDAEFLANVSLFPAKDGTAYYEYSANTFQSLPIAAKEKGYQTAVMHPFRPGFWNRPPMYQALGFDAYLNQQDFELDEIYGMGLADHSFYRQAVQKMQQMQQPFYTFLISLSSHFPFTDPNVDLSEHLDVGALAGTVMGDYLQNINYADEAIGILIDELQAAKLWDNSVVVFYGDHAAVPPNNNHELAQLLYGKDELDKREWQKAQKVVMMLHFPNDQLRGENNLTVGQIDLFPTLANLLGFNCHYHLGQDLLNTDSGFVCLRNGTWLNDDVIYFRASGEVKDLQTGKTLEPEEYAETITDAESFLQISDLMLEHNLIKHWQTGTDD